MKNQKKNLDKEKVRLSDLCPEEKKKIGDLIKKLAQEKT